MLYFVCCNIFKLNHYTLLVPQFCGRLHKISVNFSCHVQRKNSVTLLDFRISKGSVATNTVEEGLRETKNNAFGLATEDRRRQYQLRRTKDVRPGQV